MDNRIENQEDIVFASRVVMEEGCFPVRVVLRKLDNEYVVHKEILEFASAPAGGTFYTLVHKSFEDGNYFCWDSKIVNDDLVFPRAMDTFIARVAKL